jgi:hypothetical protein
LERFMDERARRGRSTALDAVGAPDVLYRRSLTGR